MGICYAFCMVIDYSKMTERCTYVRTMRIKHNELSIWESEMKRS